MEVDPYKILQLKKNFSLEELRSQYKKIALAVHPDKCGETDYMFKLVTKCYKILLNEYNNRQSDKQFDVLKASYDKYQDSEKRTYNQDIEPGSRFNIDRFNNVFENNRPGTATDVGYTEWMEKNILKDAPELTKGITPDRFNELFEKYTDSVKDKRNKQIIKFKEPEPLSMSKKLNFIELGMNGIDDFSGENSKGLNFTDYRVAHSTTRLVDPNNVKKRKEFRTIGEYERDRDNMSKLSNRELAYYEKKKQLENEKETHRQQSQRELDKINFDVFQKMNKMMISGR